MTNVEARRNARIRIIGTSRSRLRHSGFDSPSSFVIRTSSFRAEGAVTIVELLVVITIILILAGLILSISSYVQNKGARARAETEIAAMSAALESYKADNGIYPTRQSETNYTDPLNARLILDRHSPRRTPTAMLAYTYIATQRISDANQQPSQQILFQLQAANAVAESIREYYSESWIHSGTLWLFNGEPRIRVTATIQPSISGAQVQPDG